MRCFPAGLSDFFLFGGIAQKKQPRPKINHGILLRYFFRSVRIREIPAAVLAVPVGGISFCLLGGCHSLNLRQIDMVIRIQIPVGLAAYLADSAVQVAVPPVQASSSRCVSQPLRQTW